MPRREIVFTNDLDGVHFKAPPPFKTTISLIRGRLSIPPLGDNEPAPYVNGNRVADGISWLTHRWRPYRKDASHGLQMFIDAAKVYDRELKVAILSGRQGTLHALTTRLLEKSGRMELFHEAYLNESASSSGWKEATVKKLLAEGRDVVHIDDDLRPALRIARLDGKNEEDPHVLVYLLGNLSNQPMLLRRAGIELPENVMRVKSFREAGIDFTRRLRQGKF